MSPTTLARALICYLLLPDDELRVYTQRILHLYTHRITETTPRRPLDTFIKRSYDVCTIIEKLRLIAARIHEFEKDLMTGNITMQRSTRLNIPFMILPKFTDPYPTLLITTSEILATPIDQILITHGRAMDRRTLFERICTLLKNARIDPITTLNIPELEQRISKRPQRPLCLLINHYFFRKVADNIENRNILSIKQLTEHLRKEPTYLRTPPLFILIEKEAPKVEELSKIVDALADEMYSQLREYVRMP